MRKFKTQTNPPAAARRGSRVRVENLEDRQYRAAHPIGINVNDSSTSAFNVAVPQLKKLGVTDVRLWYGVDKWSDQSLEGGLKRAIDYHNAGFDVTLTIAIDDKKVPDPADVKAWFKWATSNKELREAVDYWQVGNEVDSDNYFKGTLSEYVSHFLKPAYNVLHANGEKVISGSVSWNPQDVQSMIDNGMLDYCDAVGFHPYAKGVSLQKTRIQQITDVVDGRKPIVATEWNIRGYENDKSAWADAVGDAFSQVRAGFALDFYFAMFTVNTPAGPGGLMSNKGVLNQAFYNQFLAASKGVGSNTESSGNSASSTVTQIALYNADTDTVISGYTNLKSGQVIDLASLPTRNLALVVLPSKNASSVKMVYNGTSKIENSAPFGFFGDTDGNLNGKKLAAGTYSLGAQAFSLDNAKGTAYAATSMSIKFTDSASVNTPTTSTATGSVTGTLWNDGNGNGKWDGTETATGSRTVFIDTDGDGVLDKGEKYTTANSKGLYTFTGLAAGTYHVSRVFPSGYGLSNNSLGYVDATVVAGKTTSNVNLGTINKKTATVSTSTGTTTTTTNSSKAEVLAFALVDSKTGKVIDGYDHITANTTINLAALPTKNLALIALADTDTKSVKLSVNGTSKVENTLPYAFFGDNNGKYATWTPTKGSYTFAATAYNAKNGTGVIGTSLSITLKFA
ncbi:MAG: SdrD B-like domain-containing protein [Tepidisphaeraceae bacterium]